MRVANIMRTVLLGGLIIAGFVVYFGRDEKGIAEPVALSSLVPSPVTVTVLTGPSS